MDEKEKINNLAKTFYKGLIQIGYKGLKSVFGITPQIYSRDKIFNFLYSNGFNKVGNFSLSDENYYLEDWEIWKNLIDIDWVEEHPYYKDKFDCDNFAMYFASNVAFIYELNSCGVAYGNVYNKDTGKLIDGHVFNLIIALENNVPALFLFEPMKRKWIKWDKNGDNIIDNLRYEINWILFY